MAAASYIDIVTELVDVNSLGHLRNLRQRLSFLEEYNLFGPYHQVCLEVLCRFTANTELPSWLRVWVFCAFTTTQDPVDRHQDPSSFPGVLLPWSLVSFLPHHQFSPVCPGTLAWLVCVSWLLMWVQTNFVFVPKKMRRGQKHGDYMPCSSGPACSLSRRCSKKRRRPSPESFPLGKARVDSHPRLSLLVRPRLKSECRVLPLAWTRA